MKLKGVCKEKVFEKAFRDNSEILRNYLYYRSGDLQRSEDIVQESFVSLWENCHKLTEATVKSWLFKVATNKLYNESAKDKVRFKFESQITGSIDYETPEFKLEYEEYSNKLQNAINNLPEGQREAFLLNRVDNLKYKEIAECLNISVKAVEKRISQALKKLNNEIFIKKI